MCIRDSAKAVQAEEAARRAGQGDAALLAKIRAVPGCEALTWDLSLIHIYGVVSVDLSKIRPMIALPMQPAMTP